MSSSLNQRFTPWSLLKFAAPSIVMMVFMSLYTIVDGIFVSRFVGSNALSATNIVYPVLNIAIAFATMLATGGNAIISRYLGEDRPQKANACLTQYVVIALGLGVLISILVQIFATPLSLFWEPMTCFFTTATCICARCLPLLPPACCRYYSNPTL